MKMLARLGYRIEEPQLIYLADIAPDNPWASLQACVMQLSNRLQ